MSDLYCTDISKTISSILAICAQINDQGFRDILLRYAEIDRFLADGRPAERAARLNLDLEVQKMIEAGAFESAMIRAIPADATITLGIFPGASDHLSQVILPGAVGTHSRHPSSAALAIFGAYLKNLEQITATH